MPYKSRIGANKFHNFSSRDSFYGVVAVINDSSQPIYEKFIFPTLQGFRIEGMPPGSTETALNVEPGCKDIILLKRLGEQRANFHFKAQLAQRPFPIKSIFQETKQLAQPAPLKASQIKNGALKQPPSVHSVKRVQFDSD